MTQTRDFDSVARAWLDLMPAEAPDRVIASILDATERVPQARRLVPGVRGEFLRLRISAPAAAAALALAIAGIALLFTTSIVGPEPTPTPVAPSSSADAVPTSAAAARRLTTKFGPRLDPDQPPRPVSGALEYTLPDGWDVTRDEVSDIRLMRGADAAKEVAGDQGPFPSIQAWIRPAANIQTEPCSSGLAPGVGRSPVALADWVHNLPSLVSLGRQPVTIHGVSGQLVDTSLAPSGAKPCDGADAGLKLFAEAVGAGGPVGEAPWAVGLSGPTRLRCIFLDLGAGRTVMVLIEDPDPATFDAFVAEAMPIVQSFTFK